MLGKRRTQTTVVRREGRCAGELGLVDPMGRASLLLLFMALG